MGLPFSDVFQPSYHLIDDNTQTLAAGQVQRNINLREKLPEMVRGLPGHCIGLIIRQDLDPTYTNVGTQRALADSIARVTIRGEKGRVMVDLSGSEIRASEAYENAGRLLMPDPDLNSASTNNQYSYRFVSFAPLGFRALPFALPTKLLDASVAEITYGSLTAWDATDPTAATCRTVIHALCVGLPHVNIPPKLERKSWPASGNQLELGDRALLLSMMLFDASTQVAITAGDFATFTLNDRKGEVFSGIPAQTLTAAYYALAGMGQFGIVTGEPSSATEDNPKVVGSTPTALAAPVLGFQPLVFCAPGSEMDSVEIEGPTRLRWSGTQSTAHIVTTRALPRAEDEARELALRVFQSLKLPLKGGALLDSKGAPYQGPRPEYQNWNFFFR